MSHSTRVRITLDGGVLWDVQVLSETLRKVDNLPSGKIGILERKVGDVQKQQVFIRPYYRRIINNELHIFAVQVTPKEEPRHGK